MARARGEEPPTDTAVTTGQETAPAEAKGHVLVPLGTRKPTPYELLEGIHDALDTQIAEGEVLPFDFSVSSGVQEVEAYDPLRKRHIPWLTAQISNDGPNTVQVAVNYPHRGGHPLKINETYTIDMTKSERKIDYLYFMTAAGESAAGRAVAKY